MARITTTGLFELWNAKERREGRRLTLSEVAKATSLSMDTVRGLRDGTTTRFDADVLVAMCEYFEVPEGPVPFMVFTPAVETKAKKSK